MIFTIVLKFSRAAPDERTMEVPTARSLPCHGRILQTLDRLAPFSPIIAKLIAGLAKEDISLAELARLIEKDTVIAGHLLRTVNSALYGLPGTVSSVPHAIAILGCEKLRNTVLALSLARMWRQSPAARNWSAAAFNLHAAATAILADLLAQHLPAASPESAFAAGLFHDVGKLLAAAALPSEYELLCTIAHRKGMNTEQQEETVMGITHSELSALAVTHWRLPSAIGQAVRWHHAPEGSAEESWPLSRLVSAADLCVNAMGISVPPTIAQTSGSPEDCMFTLGLADRAPRLLEEFSKELDLLRSFF
jgi:HD-like signal output (HDOD) protein